jgi:secondary thiamine-phosphate synthase enzyme
MLKKINLNTPAGEGLLNITSYVVTAVQESQVEEGICLVFCPHTTAGLTINSAMDANTLADLRAELRRLVPTRVDFQHIYDTPADAAGHIKATLVDSNLALMVSQSRLLLGSSQSILFCEFDGPRERQVWVRVLAEK